MDKCILTRLAALIILPVSCASSVFAESPESDGAVLSTRAEIDRVLAKTNDGLSVWRAPTDGKAVVILAHREKDGDVEVHSEVSDVLIGRDGAAEVLIGGCQVGGRETAPGERLGGTIVGGRRMTLGPGDIIWVPASVPHQMFMLPGGKITYMALKYHATDVAAQTTLASDTGDPCGGDPRPSVEQQIGVISPQSGE